MKQTIPFYLFFLSTLSYCADKDSQDPMSSPTHFNLDTIARKVVRPLAIYSQPPRPGKFGVVDDDFIFACDLITHPFCTLRFPYWSSDTETKRIERTTAILRNYNSITELQKFKKEAMEHNIDANCFNYAGNTAGLYAMVTLPFPRIPKIGKMLAFAPSIFFKYKVIEQTPLYDLDTIDAKMANIKIEKTHN